MIFSRGFWLSSQNLTQIKTAIKYCGEIDAKFLPIAITNTICNELSSTHAFDRSFAKYL